MSHKIDCQVFNAQLDSLNKGTLSEDAVAQLLRHAQTCPDCGALLRMHEQLTEIAPHELERSVPDEMVTSMWKRVEDTIADDEIRSSDGRASAPRARWLERLFARPSMRWAVPIQTVAIVVLVAGTSVIYTELQQLREREETLRQQLSVQDRRIDEMDQTMSQSNVARMTGLADRFLWQERLSGRGDMTVSELNHFLRSMPSDALLLEASDAGRLLRNVSRNRVGHPAKVMKQIQTSDGLRAGEALLLIEAMDLPPGDRGPARWLLSFSRRYDL